jgi:hypothetical protein
MYMWCSRSAPDLGSATWEALWEAGFHAGRASHNDEDCGNSPGDGFRTGPLELSGGILMKISSFRRKFHTSQAHKYGLGKKSG